MRSSTLRHHPHLRSFVPTQLLDLSRCFSRGNAPAAHVFGLSREQPFRWPTMTRQLQKYCIRYSLISSAMVVDIGMTTSLHFGVMELSNLDHVVCRAHLSLGDWVVKFVNYAISTSRITFCFRRRQRGLACSQGGAEAFEFQAGFRRCVDPKPTFALLLPSIIFYYTRAQ